MPIRTAAAGKERKTTRALTTSGRRWRQRRSFSMLADDLLVVVYRLLGDYPSSRARFCAVCKSWRAAVAAEPRVPVLPWLLLSPRQVGGDRTRRAHCLEDGALMRISPRLGAVGRRLVGGYDGCWVVSCHPPPIRIVNLFSGAEVALSEKQGKIACPHRDHGRGDTRGPIVVMKIVFSESPTSDGCIMAAITENCGIALCRVGCPLGGWTIHGCRVETFIDIAFCNGDLYGLTNNGEELIKFEIGENKHGAPMVIAHSRVAPLRMVSREQSRNSCKEVWWEVRPWAMRSTPAVPHRTTVPLPVARDHRGEESRNSCKEFTVYIVDLHGELAIAVMTWWWGHREPFFKVYKFVDNVTGENKWEEVTSLGDQALFLGEIFSKAVHVPRNKHGDVERNRIYYVNNCCRSLNSVVHGDAVFMTISNHDGDLKCERKDGTSIVDDEITSVGYFMKYGSHDIMWLLPPDI